MPGEFRVRMSDARPHVHLAPLGSPSDGPGAAASGPRPAPAEPGPGAASFDLHRMAALSFLAGGIAHDLANPLGAILAFGSYLASDPRLPDDMRADAALLRAEAARTHRIVRLLLELTRTRPPGTGPVSVPDLLGGVLELAAYPLAEATVEREIADDLPAVESDASRLGHLLLVLVTEAVRGLGERPAGGRLRVAATPAAGGHAIRVELAWVRDEAGSEAAAAAPASLADARILAGALGGHLRFEPAPGGGRLLLDLPALGPAESAGTSAGAPADRTEVAGDARPDRRTILVCDDEATVRSLLVRLLERGGFRVIEAAGPDAALALLASQPVDAVLTDQHMDAMTGIGLFERATAARPELRTRFVLMSGDPSAEELVRFAEANGLRILAKPFELGAIAATLREVTGA